MVFYQGRKQLIITINKINIPVHLVLVLPASIVLHLLHQIAAEALREKRHVVQVFPHLAGQGKCGEVSDCKGKSE